MFSVGFGIVCELFLPGFEAVERDIFKQNNIIHPKFSVAHEGDQWPKITTEGRAI